MNGRNPEMNYGQLEFDEFAAPKPKPKKKKIELPPDAKLGEPKPKKFNPFGKKGDPEDKRYT